MVQTTSRPFFSLNVLLIAIAVIAGAALVSQLLVALVRGLIY